MFYLLLALLCSAAISVVLKVGDRRKYDRYGMLTVNYLTCLVAFLVTQIGRPFPSFGSSLKLCLSLGAVNGFLYLGCMAMNQINVKRNGAILQSTFARLGVMVPTLLSILFFGERPSAVEICAIVLVLVAFSVMNIPDQKKTEETEKTRPAVSLLLLGLFFGGASDSMSKVFQVYGDSSLDDWFVGITFFFALLIALVIMFVKKERIGKTELAIGIALGVPNYISTLLLLKALSSVSAYIAYPTYSVGAILVVIASSVLIFKEKITKWSRISVVMIIVAIILLNI